MQTQKKQQVTFKRIENEMFGILFLKNDLTENDSTTVMQ